MKKTACELFAGIGGFRLGLERLGTGWETAWFSQFEPGAARQRAHECYVSHFGDLPDRNGEFRTNEDIAAVPKDAIPRHMLLTAGFPCQDYSVAKPLSGGKGIEGKKGALWWQIRDVIAACRPPFCLFENVDRLLKSPARQRGRDFGVMLACLSDLGYAAEWRAVNAADYGAAQRRRRTFIFAWREDTPFGEARASLPPEAILFEEGLMAKAFPALPAEVLEGEARGGLSEVSRGFAFPFRGSGLMRGRRLFTAGQEPAGEGPAPLSEVLGEGDPESFLSPEQEERFRFLKGAKRVRRTSASGHSYVYSEGAVPFPDPPDRPSRTMLTSEGGVSRTSHAVLDPGTGRLRRLTPREAELLDGFPEGWTDTGMTRRQRFFCLGNALVVPMVTRMGRALDGILGEHPL